METRTSCIKTLAIKQENEKVIIPNDQHGYHMKKAIYPLLGHGLYRLLVRKLGLYVKNTRNNLITIPFSCFSSCKLWEGTEKT